MVYEGIDSALVQTVANKMKVSGGQTQIEETSQGQNPTARHLSQGIRATAEILCTEEIHPDTLEEYDACRLIPLDKGVTKGGSICARPIGVEEVL